MKLNKLFYLAAASMIMAGCGDDWNEDKLEGFGKPEVTDIKSLDITLEAADYKTISTNSTNKALAEAAGVSSQLSKLSTNLYFTDELPASTYLPAYLAATYPTADDKSNVRVTYNQLVGEPEYLKAYSNALCGEMMDEAYEMVWGDKVQAYYLTPKTENQLPKLLKMSWPAAEAGDMALVSYAYSDVEPSIGGGSGEDNEPTWTQLQVPVRATGKSWDFVNIGPVDLSNYVGQTVYIGFNYTSTDSAAATWELINFKALSVPYLDVLFFSKQEDGSFAKVANAKSFKGAGDYVIVALGADGQYYPFGRLADGKTYGYMYPAPIAVEGGVIAADAAADFVITLEATEAGYNIKNVLGQYFYMSGNYDSFNVKDAVGDEGYDWTVENTGSDQFVITNVLKQKSVKLNYYNGSYSYGSYAASKVEGKTYASSSLKGDEGGFTLYDVDLADLSYVWQNTEKYGWKGSAFANSTNYATESFLVSPAIEIAEDAALPYFTIDEAFRYGAGDASDITFWISTDYEPEAAAATRAATRSIAQNNKTALYEFDGTNWAKATVDEGTLAVLQPADYAQMNGNIDVVKYAEINYPYAKADDVLVVVYAQDNQASAKELTYDGTHWVLTTSVATKTDQFVRASGKWNYDPSVTIELPSGKGQALSTLYFQTATDWVWEHIDQPKGFTTKGQGYVTSYGNNEYYCGCSAYQGNVDWRASAAKAQYPDEYNAMSDADVMALMQKRFIEVMKGTLEVIHADAVPVEGVTVTYTINFAVYTGSTSYWTIRYVVTAPGKFEYVADSLLKQE